MESIVSALVAAGSPEVPADPAVLQAQLKEFGLVVGRLLADIAVDRMRRLVESRLGASSPVIPPSISLDASPLAVDLQSNWASCHARASIAPGTAWRAFQGHR